MKKKAFATSAVALALAMMVTGCGGEKAPDASADGDAANTGASTSTATLTPGQAPTPEQVTLADDAKIKIGYLAQNQTDQMCVLMTEALEAEAEKYGGKVTVDMSDGQSVAATQVSQAEDMIIKQMDAIIINAIDQEASAPAVQKIVDAGIPCILLNTEVSNKDIATSYVGVDDTEAGKIAIQIAADAIGGKGTVNVIQGLLGHPANELRWTGLQNEVAASYPDITIGASQAADWDRNKALNITEDWISSGNQIDAVVALNDEMAISASNAFQAAGLTDVKIVGIDALDEALEAIANGKMYGTVFQDGKSQGIVALDVAVCAAIGAEVDKEYLIPFEKVTPDNYQDYMGALG